jgi:hypothetical protein
MTPDDYRTRALVTPNCENTAAQLGSITGTSFRAHHGDVRRMDCKRVRDKRR